jgi:tRNA(fMet)-specific endonuclease VapC
MPRYMLDTDMVSYALRGEGQVGTRLLEHRPRDLCVSVITLAELRYGADLRRSRKLHGLIDTFVNSVPALPFDADAAGQFGTVASGLKHTRAPIGEFDALIASHALAMRAVLVTNNARHFDRVPGLKTENWL